jgi:carbonic anhydrase/acetyltransferase-like protein (isoleucine patch superfamily)
MILGAPARAVKQLAEPQLAMLKISADVYVRNHQRFRSGLKPVG